MKKIVLKVVKQCVGTDGVDAAYVKEEILPEYFRAFWVRRMALDRRNHKQVRAGGRTASRGGDQGMPERWVGGGLFFVACVASSDFTFGGMVCGGLVDTKQRRSMNWYTWMNTRRQTARIYSMLLEVCVYRIACRRSASKRSVVYVVPSWLQKSEFILHRVGQPDGWH